MKKLLNSFRTLLILVVMLVASARSLATTYTWTGGGSSLYWSDPANFSPAGAPGVGDTVIIPASDTSRMDGFYGSEISTLIVDSGAALILPYFSTLKVDDSMANNGYTEVNFDSYLGNGTANTTPFINTGSVSISFGTVVACNSFVNTGSFVITTGSTLHTGYLGANSFNTGVIDVSNADCTYSIGGNLTNNGAITNSDIDYPSDADTRGGIIMQPVAAAAILSGAGIVDNMSVSDVNGYGVSVGTSTADTLKIRNMLFLQQGTFTTNNKLILAPNAATNTHIGMIGTIGGASTTATLIGGVTIQQYIPGGRRAYRFYSHPFTSNIALNQLESGIDITGNGGAANGFTYTLYNNPSCMWFNTAKGNDAYLSNDPGWQFFSNANDATGDSNSFNRYKGINVFIRGAKGQGLLGGVYTPLPTVITEYGGAVNTGAQSITIHTNTHNTFNTIGNPYPCTIDIGNVLNNNSSSLGSTTYYEWDPYMASQGAFRPQPVAAGNYIGPNTAYQVEAAFDGATIAFTESDKFAGNIDTDLLRTMSPAAIKQMVTLDVYDADHRLFDIFDLQLTNDAINGFEKADAHKPANFDMSFYSLATGGDKLGVDARPYVAGDVIPMGIHAATAQTFIIRADEFYVPAGSILYLHDTYMGVYKQLLQGAEYTFDITADPASQGDSRFELRMGDVPAGVANVQGATGLNIIVTPNPATEAINICYNATTAGSTSVRITNMVGQQVYTSALGEQQRGNIPVQVQNLPAGMYNVQLVCGDKTVVQKFVKE